MIGISCFAVELMWEASQTIPAFRKSFLYRSCLSSIDGRSRAGACPNFTRELIRLHLTSDSTSLINDIVHFFVPP